jgi:addiction module HigA family antidote
MLNPPHPGDFIRTEIIEPRGLSVTTAAQVLRVSRPALSSLLNGKAGLSGDMALRVEKAFGVKMDARAHAGFLRDRADSEAGGPDQVEAVPGRAAAGGVSTSGDRARVVCLSRSDQCALG